MGEEQELRAALERLSKDVWERDMAVAGSFTADGMLVGSEPGEIARGEAELRPFFERLLAQPTRIRWEWSAIDLRVAGDIGWIFAEGDVVLAAPGGERRLAYRLSAVLQRLGGSWKWRLFHGSEPKV